MHRILKQSLHIIWLISATLIVTFAILITLARTVVTPWLAEQRPAVERWASQVLRQPVRIVDLEVIWLGFTPVLRSIDVTVFNDQFVHPLLKVNQLDLGLNIWQSIWSRQPVLSQIHINGAKLSVQQNVDDSITFTGIEALAQSSSNSAAVDKVIEWLFAGPLITLNKIDLLWRDKAGRVLSLNNLSIALQNANSRHKLIGKTDLVQKKSSPSNFLFALDITGTWQHKDTLKAEIYIKAHDFHPEQWLQNKWLEQVGIQEGSLNFECWALWHNNHFTRIQGLITGIDLWLKLAEKKALLNLKQVVGNVLWQPQADNSWIIDAQLQDVSSSRWENVPGVTHLSGYLHFTPTLGNAYLNNHNLTIDFGPLFRAPLYFTQLNTQIAWQHEAEGWQIEIANLLADTVDMQTRSDMSLWFPQNGASPTISLLSHYAVHSPHHIAYYLPLTVLKPDLIAWLENAIKQGEGAGTFILQGQLADFPFDNNVGTFLIDAEVDHVELNYWPGWPVLSQMSGELIFAGRRMDINIAHGKLLTTPIYNIQASIPLLHKDSLAVLRVNGDISTTFEQAMQFVQASPLQTHLQMLQDLDIKGPMLLNLQLAIPLELVNKESEVKGTIVTQDASINIPNRPITLQKLQGQIDFTRNTVNANNLQATLWDKPIQLTVSSNSQTQVDIKYQGLATMLIPKSTGWAMLLDNANAIGQIIVPRNNQQALQANFKQLYFNADSADNMMKWQPTQLPRLDLTSSDTRYGNKQFGKVRLQLEPLADGTRITSLQFDTPTANLRASGSWREKEGKPLTELGGKLMTKDLNILLANLGLPTSVSSKDGDLKFALRWWGAPYDLHSKLVNGAFTLNLKKGVINAIGASATAKLNFGRLLTVLSLESLGRRLTLDFSDFTSKGFEFHKLSGSFLLRNGNATTNNLILDGPVAQIVINGRIGLDKEDYDLILQITPHFTSSLPVIAALAGGPIVGAATWAINTLVGGEVQKMAAKTYRMKGSWQQPSIEKIK